MRREGGRLVEQKVGRWKVGIEVIVAALYLRPHLESSALYGSLEGRRGNWNRKTPKAGFSQTFSDDGFLASLCGFEIDGLALH